VGWRSVAGRNVNTGTYPTHSPLAEPRDSLGAVAVGRQQRRSVRSRSVGRSLYLTSNTKPFRRGGVRSRRSVSGENSCTYPTHSPLAEPRGSLGAVAVSRWRRRSVGRRSVIGRWAVGKRQACALCSYPTHSLLAERLAARLVRSRSVGGGCGCERV